MEPKSVRVETYSSRAAWLAARWGSLGGSDVPALFGHGYESELSLWVRLREELRGPAPDPDTFARHGQFDVRFAMGAAAEPVLRRVAELDTRLSIVRPAEIVLFRHPPLRMHATPDAFALSTPPQRIRARTLHRRARAIASFKTVLGHLRDDWPDGAPAPYALIQVQHELLLTGLEEAFVTAIFDLGPDTTTVRVEAHREFQEQIVERVARFWESIQRDIPPEPRGSESDAAAIRRLFPLSRKSVAFLPPSTKELIERYESAKEAEKAARTEAEAIKQKLELLLGDAQLGVVPDSTKAISWKSHTRTEKPRTEERAVTQRPLLIVNRPKYVDLLLPEEDAHA